MAPFEYQICVLVAHQGGGGASEHACRPVATWVGVHPRLVPAELVSRLLPRAVGERATEDDTRTTRRNGTGECLSNSSHAVTPFCDRWRHRRDPTTPRCGSPQRLSHRGLR